MKQGFHKIAGNTLQVLHLESVRTMFYQVAGVLFLSVFLLEVVRMFFDIAKHYNPFSYSLYAINSFEFADVLLFLIIWILGIILPAIAILLSRRFPPAPAVVFNNNTQMVTWKNVKFHLELQFNTIHFSTSRLLSKSGISTVIVSIFAINDKPFFVGETPTTDPAALYRKDLCVYKAGTQVEADESIEIIKSFMAGTYDDSPSKFDDI